MTTLKNLVFTLLALAPLTSWSAEATKLEDITVMALGALDGRAVVKTTDGKMQVLKVRYRGTGVPAGKRIRAEAEGQPCPECGEPMISDTNTAPWPQHNPTVVEKHYEGGGARMTSAEKKAYVQKEASLDEANCKQCQLGEGGHAAQYSAEWKRAILEARQRIKEAEATKGQPDGESK